MLTRLHIQNFKAWRDTTQLNLAPLTLFFGPNSSGKSSINHFLMMLKQTVRSPDRNNVFDYGDVNSAVRLGSFRDIIFGHDRGLELTCLMEWTLQPPLTVRDPKTGARYIGNRLVFTTQARQNRNVVQSTGLEYRLTSDGKTTLAVRLRRNERRPDRWDLASDQYDLVRNPGRAWELPKPVQFYGFPDEAALYYQNTLFLADLQLALETSINGISYLGPLRSPPERLYGWSGNIPEDVGWQGQNAVQAILAAEGRTLNFSPRGRHVAFEAVIARWLTRMGLLNSFSVKPIGDESEAYAVAVQSSAKAEEVRLTDVGFGVSQVLPVVVQAFYAPPRSTILMEQPEIHLHPAVQADLADLLIAAIQAREDGAPRGVQVIVESHSEHLLRRLQRRIAEEVIDSADVAMFFCSGGPNGSFVERLEVDTYGNILNWPPDFFGDELEDVSVQARLGVQRRLNI